MPRHHQPINLAVTPLIIVALAFATTPTVAQEQGSPQFVTATSVTADAADMSRVRQTMERMQGAAQLRLVSRFGDRRLRNRVHESFRQFHRGVPVQGGGLTLQHAGGAAVSILGTLHHGIDVETSPRLSPSGAVARATELAGVGPATDDPPTLTVLPTPLGGYALAWRLVMKDMNAWFIDAITGEPVSRDSLIQDHQGIAVGSGLGAFGQRQKLSVTAVARGFTGEGFETRDQLRGAEIVTLDMRGDANKAYYLLDPDVFWGPRDVALSPDNNWRNQAVVDVHAHLGLVYDYLLQQQQWRGMDGDDGRIVVATNVFNLPNAFFVPSPFGFEGTGGLVFGDLSPVGGDGTKPQHFGSLDIVGHEFMHGVTHSSVHRRTGEAFGVRHTYVLGPKRISVDGAEFRCGDVWDFREGPDGPLACEDGRFLLFWNEAGAINEAMSDIVGAETEFAFHPPGEGPLHAEWRMGEDALPTRAMDDPGGASIGEGIHYPDATGLGFRFLVAVVGERLIRYTGIMLREGRPIAIAGDGGYDGVHWNSAPLSHSFFLAVEGGQHRSSGITVVGAGGANRDRVARIYFRAMTELMPARGSFEMFAAAVRQSAVDLYGRSSTEYEAVHQALTAVGLPVR
jgi:Zn-dependent metalloprotease